ncbi:hypothetical protein FQR65_LT01365 [Abscondita terminalis]|nr:hypothetical protein FQR65_LT01365 [Abscondita terminalis]
MQTALIFRKSQTESKDNEKSVYLRILANEVSSKDENLEEYLNLYNKSLRYATYDSDVYAFALADRSVILFKMCEYEKAIEDIDLCLRGKSPNSLKAEVYLRKCECYKNLGDGWNLKKTTREFKLFIANELTEAAADEFKKKLQNLISFTDDDQVVTYLDDVSFDLPTMERNIQIPEASIDLTLKKKQLSSLRKISKGQVLLIEKAYAFSPWKNVTNFCQYCLKKILNGTPCRKCVKYMYCRENCETLAWNEFHQWECCAIQANFFKNHSDLQLVFRIILKACHNAELLTQSVANTKYSLIHNLDPNLHNKEYLQVYAEDKMDSYLCIRCGGPAIDAKCTNKQYKCLSCEWAFQMPQKIQFNMMLADYYLRAFHTEKDINMANSALALRKTFLNPHHRLNGELYQEMFHYYLERNEYEAVVNIMKLQLEYHKFRSFTKTVENVLHHIRFCTVTLHCLTQGENFSTGFFNNALDNVKESLEEAMEINSYFYPPLTEILKLVENLYKCVRNIH